MIIERAVVGQSYRVTHTTISDLTGASILLKYQKPDGTAGSVAGAIDSSGPSGSTIHADMPAGTNDTAGTWYAMLQATVGAMVYKTYSKRIEVIEEFVE